MRLVKLQCFNAVDPAKSLTHCLSSYLITQRVTTRYFRWLVMLKGKKEGWKEGLENVDKNVFIHQEWEQNIMSYLRHKHFSKSFICNINSSFYGFKALLSLIQ